MTRRGRKTSEFVLAAAVIVGQFAAALEGVLPARYAAGCSTVAAAAYAVSRGLAKSGGQGTGA